MFPLLQYRWQTSRMCSRRYVCPADVMYVQQTLCVDSRYHVDPADDRTHRVFLEVFLIPAAVEVESVSESRWHRTFDDDVTEFTRVCLRTVWSDHLHLRRRLRPLADSLSAHIQALLQLTIPARHRKTCTALWRIFPIA